MSIDIDALPFFLYHLKHYLYLRAATDCSDKFVHKMVQKKRKKVGRSLCGSSRPYLFANNFGQLVSVDSVNVVHVELEHVLLAPVAQLVLLHRKAHRTDRLL